MLGEGAVGVAGPYPKVPLGVKSGFGVKALVIERVYVGNDGADRCPFSFMEASLKISHCSLRVVDM